MAEMFASKGYQLIVVLTLGTTIGHGCDDVKKCFQIVEAICANYKCRFWIHVDAALHGTILPFMRSQTNGQAPQIDFQYMHSLNVSAHKWLGVPWPCGIYITKRSLCKVPEKDGSSAYANDWELAPLGCGRNSSAVVVLSHLLQKNTREVLTEQIERQRTLMQSALEILRNDPIINCYTLVQMPSPYSLCLMLKVPTSNRVLQKKYTLPTLDDGFTQI